MSYMVSNIYLYIGNLYLASDILSFQKNNNKSEDFEDKEN